ncbi:peptidoglycan DD-metalloendopeptidase family protein [Flammeovirga sp. MY04]|uniref:murein hydrolase activator EnvC family protein n=1 Tax=Flammeovirga sp. MY04 TaxID=1191459 RepID=UPI0008062DA5|nr:peptidoglycan DD-metalloendopeptidase family protein [Flammeovirga sp. MY04]ANQ50826.1 peptidoglycan DD-metalloendopeptidase family protein [Flammeovirga sp. MY04]
MRFFFTIIAICFSYILFAQQDVQQAKKKIAQTSAILKNTTEQKETSLSELSDLEAQIEGLEHLLDQINKRINVSKKEALLATHSIDSLNDKVLLLKQEYAQLVYASYKTGGDFEQLAYLLASDNFSQFVRRASYIEHYKEIRKKQILEIERTQALLADKKVELEERNKEEQVLLKEEKAQLASLKSLEKQQSELIADLKNKEEYLKKQLEQEREGLAEIQRQMLAITTKIKSDETSRSKELAIVSSKSFDELQGTLIWPVPEGVITNRFGVRPHPILEGVSIENHGIDIRVKQNTKVKTVHKGVVTAVSKVPNLQNVVMLRHGNYFTVYSKLSKVYVKVGDQLPSSKAIGLAGKNEDGVYEVQFQIWNTEGQKLDPEQWLATD